MANEKLFAVDFGETVLNAQDVLLAEDVEHAWDHAMLEGLLALSAQSVGGALQILETTIAYAKEREQFGRPIGAFQSIAHYLADAATEIQGVRYLAYQACWALDNGLPFSKLALMAKLQCNAVFRRTAVTAVQIHGGMGFTLEADPQLYYRRAKSQQLQYWDPMYLEERIATEVFS
jgi:alkylation response protein AidB-like acyl-CoA dehydrogenase